MPSPSHPGAALPGWGWRLRRWSNPSAALTLAAFLTLASGAGHTAIAPRHVPGDLASGVDPVGDQAPPGA